MDLNEPSNQPHETESPLISPPPPPPPTPPPPPCRNSLEDVVEDLSALSLNPRPLSPISTIRYLAPTTGIPLNRRAFLFSYGRSKSTIKKDDCSFQPQSPSQPADGPSSPAAQPDEPTPDEPPKLRQIEAEYVLEAPSIVNDYYWNVLSWSCEDILAVALRKDIYFRRLDNDDITHLRKGHFSDVSSLRFSQDGQLLGAGLEAGSAEIWDVETRSLIRRISGYQSAATSLSWNKHVLTLGHHNGGIVHYDVRLGKPKVLEVHGHDRIVCGLEWRSDGEVLASGCDGGVVNLWDGRIGGVGPSERGTARWRKREHKAAVKALAWCPWRSSLLASGGGISDGKVLFWDTDIGECLHTLEFNAAAQVTSIQWSNRRKEFLTTFGNPKPAIMVHSYPDMEKVVEEQDAHESRILWSTVGPTKDVVCTGGADGNLKVWKVWGD